MAEKPIPYRTRKLYEIDEMDVQMRDLINSGSTKGTIYDFFRNKGWSYPTITKHYWKNSGTHSKWDRDLKMKVEDKVETKPEPERQKEPIQSKIEIPDPEKDRLKGILEEIKKALE